MKKDVLIKSISTLVAFILIVIHMFYPDIRIDSITLGLMVIAILPWLASVFKSIELPGVMKLELQDVQKIANKADKVGMIEKDTAKINQVDYTFQIVAKEDPKLALAGLRIEIEDRLRKIAEKSNIKINNMGLNHIMKILLSHDLITTDEEEVLSDMIALLNAAVHSDEKRYDYRNANWALDVGTKLLNNLSQRLNH